MRSITLWVDGKPLESTTERWGEVYNPATGEQTAKVPFATPAEVEAVIASATAAQKKWGRLSISRRSEVLFAFRHLVFEHRHELAALITAEHGKTLDDALGEVSRGLENIEYACGLSDHLKGEFTSQISTGIDVHSILQPVGVVAGITPFNFPVMVPMWMTANAIACGNAIILKPSEKDPSASMRIAELLTEAGLPDGVFNVLHGDAEIVGTLLEHKGVQAVSFVGSTPIAKSIYERGTQAGKRVQALGGAKNHMLVLPDADIDVAADAAVSAAYGSAGERCMAISVLVAVGDVADKMIDAIAERMAALRVGPGDAEGTEMGPLISKIHRDKVASYVEGASAEGAKVCVDGSNLEVASANKGGFFFGPSLIDNVRPGMKCYDDEIFGPVLSVVRVDTYDEGIELINSNPYGNGVAIFTRDGGAARQFTVDIEVGMVGVNVPVPVPVASYSFGGWKDSLFGDTHMYGPEGIDFFTRTKVITTRWPDPSTSEINLGFPTTR